MSRLMNRRAGGFTIIEFMIAMTLSLLVLAALTGTFVANSRARNEIERANQQIENGRYALQIMSDDLELAGYLSHLNMTNVTTIPDPTSKPDPCVTTVAGLNATFMMHIQGYDSLASASALSTAMPQCATLLADWKPGTDIVVIRRAATCRGGVDANCAMVAGAAYFQASLCGSGTELNSLDSTSYFRLDTNLANLDRQTRTCSGTRAEMRQYMTNIYFVANDDQPADGIPTLKRLELGATGGSIAFVPVSLAHGIRDLQLEYGIDTDGDGAPNAFTANPDTYNGAISCNSNCITNWRNVMAVRLNVLSQNSTKSPDFFDRTKIYTLGLNAANTTQCAIACNGASNPNPPNACDAASVCGAFGDAYKKHVYQTSVRLMNPAGRRDR